MPARNDHELFDAIAPDYVRKDLNPYGRAMRRLRLLRTLRYITLPVGSILEIGCGGGFTADYLRGSFERYAGVDYSAELIALAERYNAAPGVRFLCADAATVKLEERFDVIVMIGVLHHLPDPLAILERLRALLRPAGVLVVNEPQRGNPIISLLRRLRARFDPHYSDTQVELSETELVKLLDAAGYHARVFPQGILSTPLAETLVLPSFLGRALARLFARLDPIIEDLIAPTRLRRWAWNICAEARPIVPDNKR